jgi:hypothetical protein
MELTPSANDRNRRFGVRRVVRPIARLDHYLTHSGRSDLDIALEHAELALSRLGATIRGAREAVATAQAQADAVRLLVDELDASVVSPVDVSAYDTFREEVLDTLS